MDLLCAGDDATHQLGVSRSYIDNGDGTVADNATGLIWQKCSRGQNNDATCTGTATTSNWTDAQNYCSRLSLASKTWRLPSRQELETLPDYSKTSSAAIDTTFFPSAPVGPMSGEYWSSTTYRPSASNAWFILFNYGAMATAAKLNLYYVRCVFLDLSLMCFASHYK